MSEQSNDYQTRVSNLISYLKDINEDGENCSFQTMELDLLDFSFPEFLASEIFISLAGCRRKDLFEQYVYLKQVLSTLSDFFYFERKQCTVGK